jgi:TonB-dependent receptor
MKKSLELRRLAGHQPLRPALSATAAACLSLICAGNAFAQQADPQQLDTVTVTGARKSAETAQAIKKKSDQVVDSIVAEDIGKFPDKNVAEILGRVTGVQILRGNGEAGNVIVRGLGGIVTLLNGREFFSDAGRSLWLADIPATMLQRIDVYKTQSAELSEGGTAGVIDVRTNRPFDFKDTQVFGSGRIERRDKAKVTNPDLSGMASTRWKTDLGEMGALVGLSYQNGKYHDERAWLGDPLTFTNAGRSIVGSDAVGRVLDLGERKRLAANFALQWKPAKDVEVFLEGFGTQIDHDFQQSFLVAGAPVFEPNSVVTVKPGTNLMDTVTNTNYVGWGFTSTQAKRDTVGNNQLALGANWQFSDQLRLSTELARTNSHITWANRILDTGYTPTSTVAAVRDGGGFIDYPGFDLTNPANFRLNGGVDVHGRRTGNSTDWRGDAVYEFADAKGFLRELGTGLRFADRDAGSINTNQPWQAGGPNVGRLMSTLPGVTESSPATWGDYGVKSYVYASRDWLLNNYSDFRQLITGSTAETPYDPLTYFDINERTKAAYGKAKFGFDVGGVEITGVAGLRVVRTEQALSGNSRNEAGVISPVNVNTSTTDTLPSLSLKAQLSPQWIARLVAGKTIERPAFVDYNPGLQLFPPGGGVTYGSGSSGNPYLKPTESTNYDLALEYYFSRTGYVSATLFDHRFKNRLARDSKTEMHDGKEYLVSRPYNLSKANLKGYELSYRQFFDFLPGWASGFGVEANYTYMTGEQTSPTGVTTPFLGQSKTAYNLVALYEREAFYSRLAYNWRSKFLAESPYRSTGRELWVADLSTLDASLGYHLNKQITVSLDVTNLLNQAYHDYFDKNPSMVRDVRYYDRTVGLSLRWKL